MKAYFVTGTDTGVGKTFIAAALVRRARELQPSVRAFAFKPFETGSTTALGDDQRLLVEAAGSWQEGSLRGLGAFRLPAAPYVAAKAEGATLDLEEVVRLFLEGSRDSAVSVLEGAGGWRVPITEQHDMAALAKRLALPVLVVARAGLGTINHSLLTLEAVERDKCSVAALVISERPDDDAAFTESNAREIARRWPGQVIIVRTASSALDVLL